jgi:hypothetical protein
LEFPEFERQFRAVIRNSMWSSLPLDVIYKMPVGTVLRFGYPQNNLVKPLPSTLQKDAKANGFGLVLVRRMAEGMFETRVMLGGQDTGAFNPEYEISFNSLPRPVEDLLEPVLDQPVLTAEEQAAMQKGASNPGGFGLDFSDFVKHDPIADLGKAMLPALGKRVGLDMAMALPDMSVFSLGVGGSGTPTVGAIMRRFSTTVDWAVRNGAVIGKLPTCEQFGGAQVKRDVLAKLLQSVRKQGVVDAASLARYAADQRPTASDSWADVMMLALAGPILDQSYVGDYPYNVRLYTALSKADWQLIETGQPFIADRLSPNARRALQSVLLQSRSRMAEDRNSPGVKDPAYWPSLNASDLIVTADLVESPVLIGWTSAVAEVSSAKECGQMYEMRRKHLSKEPLYQPATRKKLSLKVVCRGEELGIETGFSEVMPGSSPAVTYMNLPANLKAEFEEGQKMMRLRPTEGEPPPAR